MGEKEAEAAIVALLDKFHDGQRERKAREIMQEIVAPIIREYNRAVHSRPPLGAWRGACGHLWDRAVEDTTDCPRCASACAIASEPTA